MTFFKLRQSDVVSGSWRFITQIGQRRTCAMVYSHQMKTTVANWFQHLSFDSKWIQNLDGVHLKSLLLSDDIWRHWSWSTLAQVMARGLWLVAWRHNHSPDRTLFTQVPRHSISMKNASNITGKIASKYFISNSFSHGGNTTLFRG